MGMVSVREHLHPITMRWIGIVIFLFSTMALVYANSPWQQKKTRIPTLQIYAEFDNYQVAPKDTTTLIIRGFLEPGWHIYSIQSQGDDGPIPTTITYSQSLYQPAAPLQESPPSIVEDKALRLKLAVHKEKFIFKQKLKILGSTSVGEQTFEGALHYQICDNHICAPIQHHLFTTPLTVQ
ncbi:MAG: hypothetical protein HQM14_16765 [SAR324 cluster bacterium]|nr:hypothetical protein [SAR324 cluster bacterium]